jgi:hypothetical protein
MRLIVKNLGTDRRPDFRVFTDTGEEISNVFRVGIDADPDGTTANVVIDLDDDEDGVLVPDDGPDGRGPTKPLAASRFCPICWGQRLAVAVGNN